MDKETKYKIAGQVLKANDDGSIRFRLITDILDRDSEVMLPMGAQLTNWKANGVWLWAHNREAWGGLIRPPIGKINPKTIEQATKFLDVDVFFDEKNDDFAKMIAAKHRDEFLKASSVGFDPIKINLKPIRDGQKGVTHEEFEIFEGSSVPVPANPEALQQNEWGDFIDKCKKYGIKNTGMKIWLEMAGWTTDQIKDGLPNDNLTMVIPYDKTNVTTTDNYEIADVSDSEEVKEPKPDDNKTDVEADKDEEITLYDEIVNIARVLESDEPVSDATKSDTLKAITEKLEPLKDKPDDTLKIALDELNSINLYSEPDASSQILTQLKEIGNTMKS